MIKALYSCPKCKKTKEVGSVSINMPHFKRVACETCKKDDGKPVPLIYTKLIT